jgi:hypothetical protein
MNFAVPTFRTKTIPDFYHRANEMRARYDRFFSDPQHHDEQHQIFDLWYVKNHYAYWRCQAAKLIGDDLYQDFRHHLLQYAKSIGFTSLTGSYLSIYTHGCHQRVHSDMHNGSAGFVFSITNWASRTFTGGETMVARENIFDKLEPREHRGATSYFESIPSEFNQLTLFDDRLAHYVTDVQGTLDPLQARIVIHGHII